MMITSDFIANYQHDQSNPTAKLLATYCALLQEYAQKVNLTTIIKTDDIYLKHFYDSAIVFNYMDFKMGDTLLDLGSGAGFPGLVIAIFAPFMQVTLLEPTAKKANFLNMVIKTLQLANVKVICKRAEEHVIEAREYYDYVTARAVANLPMLLELATPLLKTHGHILAYKMASTSDELASAETAIKRLYLKVEKTYDYTLPGNLDARLIYDFLKMQKTPSSYPRKYAQIKKQPLGKE